MWTLPLPSPYRYPVRSQYLSTMEQQTKPVNSKPKKEQKKDLLKLERPTFQVKRTEQGSVQGIIEKLMQEKKEKPTIGFMPRSHLLGQLDSFLPALKDSNNKLLSTEIKEQQKFDAKLQEVESSSSSEDEEQDEDAMIDESEKADRMERQKPESTVLQSSDQFQFNIMTYPYPDKEAVKEEKIEQKLQRVVEIKEKDHQMEQLD